MNDAPSLDFVPSLKLINHSVEGKNNASCQSVRDFHLMFAYPGCSLINLIPFLIAYSNSLLLACPQPVLNIIGLVQKLGCDYFNSYRQLEIIFCISAHRPFLPPPKQHEEVLMEERLSLPNSQSSDLSEIATTPSHLFFFFFWFILFLLKRDFKPEK